MEQYPTFTKHSLDSDERQYMAKLLIETRIGDQESALVKRPSPDYRKLWEGKVSELQDISCGRFFTGTSPLQATSSNGDDTKTENRKVDSINLQKFVAMNFKLCRNAYVIRAKKTIQTYLETERFGMMEFPIDARKKALYSLTTTGLDRASSDIFKVVKPLFQCMALNRETKKAMYEFSQGDNMGKYVKEKELKEINGSLLKDKYLVSEVAMLILVVENYMGKENDVS